MMNKKITNEECTALISKIKSEKETVDKSTEKFKNLSKPVKDWIDGHIEFEKLNYSEKQEAISFLLGIHNYRRDSIIKMLYILTYTDDPKYVEIANKYKEIMGNSKTNKENELGIVLMNLYSKVDNISDLDMNQLYFNGKKKHSLKSELYDIQKRSNKASAFELKKIAKLKNISQLDMAHILYNLVSRLDSNLGLQLRQIDSMDENAIKNFVQANHNEIMKVLNMDMELAFCRKQEIGKIR